MRVLITGSQGYLGTVVSQVFAEAGHEVTGLDTCLFAGSVMGAGPDDPPTLVTDLRDVTPSDLSGFDAVVHLAALPEDPRSGTREVDRQVNHYAAVRLAHAAKEAGVRRYLFASTCSVYGNRPDEPLAESAALRPVSPFATCKARVEEDVAALSDADFAPVFLRLATTFGFSPRLRSDISLNRMVGDAVFTGRLTPPMDEGARRPLVHVRDVAAAFLRCLTAPFERINCSAFNVGAEQNVVTWIEIARAVVDEVPGVTLEGSCSPAADVRPSQVDFGAIKRDLGFDARWDMADGIGELHCAYIRTHLDADAFYSAFNRRAHLRALRQAGYVDDEVRPQEVLT